MLANIVPHLAGALFSCLLLRIKRRQLVKWRDDNATMRNRATLISLSGDEAGLLHLY